MSFFSNVIDALRPALRAALSGSRQGAGPAATPAGAAPHLRSRQAGRGPAGDLGTADAFSPGRLGPEATAEVDPAGVGPVRMTFAPNKNGEPDPGEIVWTWVPFEEHDGRGKDRPVLVVAAEPGGTFLVVQLTSKRHDDAEFLPVGSGQWDPEDRPSWVNLERVLRVWRSGMRREAAALDRQHFDQVAARLRERYGWN